MRGCGYFTNISDSRSNNKNERNAQAGCTERDGVAVECEAPLARGRNVRRRAQVELSEGLFSPHMDADSFRVFGVFGG